jgi:hypothetical protein
LWNHVLWRDGAEVDRFSSWPDYFTNDRAERRRLRRTWAGRADVVAGVFGRPVDQITPYLRHPHSAGLGRFRGRRRPLPGDRFDLVDPWVFIDFWQRLGITCPDADELAWAVRFPVGHAGLPSGGPDL